MARVCYLYRENIYFTSKTRKDSTLSLPLRQVSKAAWIVSDQSNLKLILRKLGNVVLLLAHYLWRGHNLRLPMQIINLLLEKHISQYIYVLLCFRPANTHRRCFHFGIFAWLFGCTCTPCPELDILLGFL